MSDRLLLLQLPTMPAEIGDRLRRQVQCYSPAHRPLGVTLSVYTSFFGLPGRLFSIFYWLDINTEQQIDPGQYLSLPTLRLRPEKIDDFVRAIPTANTI